MDNSLLAVRVINHKYIVVERKIIMAVNRNERVKVRGTVSREMAEAMEKGELLNNNGIRTRKGNYNSEQPDVWLEQNPTFREQLKAVAQEEAVRVERRLINKGSEWVADQIQYVFWPRLKRRIEARWIGLHQPIKKPVQLAQEKAIEMKALVIETNVEEKLESIKHIDNVIDFQEYKKRAMA